MFRLHGFVLAVLLGVSFALPAQSVEHSCGFDHQHQQKLNTLDDYQRNTSTFEEDLLTQYTHSQNRTTANYTIPVVVHIMHLPSDATPGEGSNISLAQIQTGLTHLNDAFRNENSFAGGPYYTNAGIASVDTQIEFCLADTNPDGHPTDGVNRVATDYSDLNVLQFASTGFTELYTLQSLSAWDSNEYLNIWIVNSICEYSNTQGCGLVGLSSFPPSHGYLDDGIVIEAAFWGTSEDNSKVQVHEAGHYLGLYHTFEGGCGEANCMTGGDRICDTPPDNSTSSGGTGITINSCATDSLINNSPFAFNAQDIYENYMDYSANSMKNTFTPMQQARMEITLTVQRASLLNSSGCSFAALPLELLDYKVTPTLQGVQITWETAHEVAVSHFDIEISTDGFHFEKIAETKAQNNPSNIYQQHIPLTKNAKYYFRLVEVDKNEQRFYFDIKVAVFSSINEEDILLYPNPVSEQNFYINFNKNIQEPVYIEIINLAGQIVFQHKETRLQQPTLQLTIPSLERGLYYVKTTVNHQSFFKKLTLQ